MTDPSSLANIAGGASPRDIENIIGVLTGIVFVILAFGIGMLALWLDYRRKRDIFQLHHAERMAAIEKGIEVPPLPPEFFQSNRGLRTPPEYLRRGLLWVLLGAAGATALYFQPGTRAQAWWGLVLAAWGVANLLFYALDSRRKATDSAGHDGAQR